MQPIMRGHSAILGQMLCGRQMAKTRNRGLWSRADPVKEHSEYRTGLMSLGGRNWVYLRNNQQDSVAGAEFKKQLSLKKLWDEGPRQ